VADYWMKLYIEVLDDPKMATLPDRIWRRIIELFLCAKRLGNDGHLPPTEQLAWMLRLSVEELTKDMNQIQPTGIVIPEETGWFIPKFMERQAAVSDRERKSQERVRKQSQQYYGNVTQQSRSVTQINRVQNTESEQSIVAAQSPSSGYIPPSQEERIYCAVTRYATIPSGDIDSVLDRLAKLKVSKGCDDNELVTYLRPFFEEQKNRYPGDTRSFWLDWAIVGQIPKPGKNGNNSNGSEPLREMTPEEKAAKQKAFYAAPHMEE
jgi:hypothetical protein